MKHLKIHATAKVDIQGMDEAKAKLEQLKQKMQEVKSLTSEVNSCISKLKLKVEI